MLSQDVNYLAETAHGVAQPLNLTSPFSRGHPQSNFVPDPSHTNLVVVLPELASQQRLPDDFVAFLPHVTVQPGLCSYSFEFLIRFGLLEYQCPEANPDSV